VRYTATSVLSASRPVVLTIGRVSDVRGLRWLSQWWVRVFRTWTAKPLSVPQMMALQTAGRDPVTYLVTLCGVLRAVLPRRWWYRLTGDPVFMILGLPDDVQPLVLKALVTVPGSERDVSREEDPVEAIRPDQRLSVHGATKDGGVSLVMAALSVRSVYGDSWYYNPARWATSDGYAPFAVALIEYAGVQALDVRRRLEVADGFSLAHAKDPRREREKMHAMAYPTEVC
jgi:hypothetical protein